MSEKIEIKGSVELNISYVVNCRLRPGIPLDFKIILQNGSEVFRNGVVFFMRNADGDFYGPMVTGKMYNIAEIKDLLEEKNIYVFAEKEFSELNKA